MNLLRRFCVCCCVCLLVSELPSSILSTINQHFMLSQFSKRKTIPTFISSPSGELERGCSPFFSLSVLNPDRMQMRMYIELGVYSQSLFYRLRCNSSWNCKYMQSFFIIFYLISSFSTFNFQLSIFNLLHHHFFPIYDIQSFGTWLPIQFSSINGVPTVIFCLLIICQL